MAIIQNKAFKDQLLVVESSLVGIKDRGVGTPNTAVVGDKVIDFHPMVRDNWGTGDALRGLLASYYAEYNSSKGPKLYNYRTLVNSVSFPIQTVWAVGEAWDVPGSIGELRKQVDSSTGGTNIILKQDGPWGTDDTAVSFRRDNIAWSSYTPAGSAGSTADLQWYRSNFKEYILDQVEGMNALGTADLIAGITVYDRVTPGTRAQFKGLFDSTIDRDYFDHTSNYFLFSSDKKTRQESGMITEIEPVYNYYISSNPDYEDVIADPRIEEYLIPNAYYLQLELQNTSSTFLAPYHQVAITMGGKIKWFRINIANSAIERNKGVYYNLYSDNMSQAIGTFNSAIEEQVRVNNGDIAILHSDLAALKSNSIDEKSLPFYNKITIGFDSNSTTGEVLGVAPLISTLLQDDDTKDFVDILQTYAIMKYKDGLANPGKFAASQRVITNSSTGDYDSSVEELGLLTPPNSVYGASLAPVTAAPAEYGLLFDMGPALLDVNSDIIDGIGDGPNDLANPRGVRFIRDYFGKTTDELKLDEASTSWASSLLFIPNTFPVTPTEYLKSFKRTLEQVYENESCHTETLMYIVEKHRRGAPLPANHAPVQTFFISPQTFPRSTIYYDTQIKYNQKYTYVFKKIVLVFGNRYKYTGVDFYTGADEQGGIHHPLGFDLNYENNISIRALVVPYSFEGQQIAIIDKPPVSPNLSFYPVKGVGSKIKILLNSSTGDYFDKPIRILDSDKQFIEEEYFGQTGMSASYEEIRTQNKKIRYKSDDLVDKYQLFRINSAPTSYRDFNNQFVEIDPEIGVVGYYEDTLEMNRKYYYCARSVDIHDNISNPTYIFELEMVDNNGQIYLRQNVFTFKQSKPTYLKDGRRFIYIEPSFQNVSLDTEVNAPADVNSDPPPDSILGISGVNKVWTKSFKLRVTSKKTGKKMDLNLTFKNTGVTNPS